MENDRTIQVRAADDGSLRCSLCQDPLKETRIALMMRNKPGGPFDPACVDCAKAVVSAAYRAMRIDDFVDQVFNL